MTYYLIYSDGEQLGYVAAESWKSDSTKPLLTTQLGLAQRFLTRQGAEAWVWQYLGATITNESVGLGLPSADPTRGAFVLIGAA